MKKTFAILADMAAIVALALAIFIACHVFPAEDDVSLDYQAIAVAALSALVTILVTWNIYQVVDWKNNLKKVDKIRDDLSGIDTQFKKERASKFLASSRTFGAHLAGNEKQEIKYYMLADGILAAKIYSELQDKDSVEAALIMMIQGLNDSKDYKLSNDQRTDLELDCGGIKDRHAFENFKTFFSLLKEA